MDLKHYHITATCRLINLHASRPTYFCMYFELNQTPEFLSGCYSPHFTPHPNRMKEQEIGYLCICQGAASHALCSGILHSEELSRLLHGKAPSFNHQQSLCEATRTPKGAVLYTCR
jgi:hypothetical protein